MADLDMGGFFGKKKEQGQQQKGLFSKQKMPEQGNIQDLTSEVDSYTNRLRILEEHYGNLRRKSQLTDQNLLQTHKKLMEEIKIINTDMTDLRREMQDIKEKVRMIIKELQEAAKKEDVNVLQKYINMWEPVNFVTRNELQKILDEYLNK